MITHAVNITYCCSGSTLSMISLMRAGRPADPTAYTSIPPKAQTRRPRYGREYANSRWSGRVLLVAISMRMRTVPRPCGADDRLEIGVARRPVELALRLVRRRVQHRRVARTPRRQRPRYATAGHPFHACDDLAHRMGMSGAEIVGARFAGLDDRFERREVRGGEIGHV